MEEIYIGGPSFHALAPFLFGSEVCLVRDATQNCTGNTYGCPWMLCTLVSSKVLCHSQFLTHEGVSRGETLPLRDMEQIIF